MASPEMICPEEKTEEGGTRCHDGREQGYIPVPGKAAGPCSCTINLRGDGAPVIHGDGGAYGRGVYQYTPRTTPHDQPHRM